jgi:acyl homoserine lactone synthase
VHVTYGSARALQREEINSLFTYRHAVFVEHLKWDLPNAKDGLEIDEFDRHDTIYVTARNADNALCGCARLLPTVRPYLLNSVFPELMRAELIPRSSDVWEISRFCSVDLGGATDSRSRQVDAAGCKKILAGTVACAIEAGAKRLIGVSVLGIERILLRLGVDAHRAGPPMRIRGHTVFAFWLEINAKTLSALGLQLSP